MPRVEGRYAAALLALAKTPQQADDFGAVLDECAQAMLENEDFNSFITCPVWQRPAKKRALKTLFAQAPTTVLHFLQLLVDKDRIALLPEIAREYQLQKDVLQGVLPIKVSSAHALSEDELAKICAHFCGQYCKARHRLDVQIVPWLIGGIRVQIGDTLYDASLFGQLEQLHRSLV